MNRFADRRTVAFKFKATRRVGKMQGTEDRWRLRAGNYRMVYENNDSEKLIVALVIGQQNFAGNYHHNGRGTVRMQG